MIHGVGKLCLDNLMFVDNYPEKNSLVHIERTEFVMGGMVANALKAADLFGSPTTLYAHRGKDFFGKRIDEELSATGINCDNLFLTEKTDYSNIIIFQDIRTIMSRRAIEHRKKASDFNLSMAKNDILIIDCTIMEGMAPLLERAGRMGVATVMDISPSNFSPRVKDLLPFVDYLIPSRDWAKKFTGHSDPDRIAGHLHDLGASDLIMTDGGNPLYHYRNKRSSSYLPCKMDVVNSNGAGDTFHGAFCHGLVRGWKIDRIVLFAMAAASCRCRYRDINQIPSEKQVLGLSEQIQKKIPKV